MHQSPKPIHKGTINLVQMHSQKQMNKGNGLNQVIQSHFLPHSYSNKQMISSANNQAPSNGSYLQLSNKHKKTQINSGVKPPQGSQATILNSQQTVRTQPHKAVANNPNLNNNIKTEIRVRQHSNPQYQPPQNIYQSIKPELNTNIIVNRVRSLSPAPGNFVQIVTTPAQQLGQKITTTCLNVQQYSPQKLVEQQKTYSPFKVYTVQQVEMMKQPGDNNYRYHSKSEHKSNIDPNVKFYDQFPLQASLIKDLEIVSPKNNSMIQAIYQNYNPKLMGGDSLIQSLLTPKYFESGMSPHQSIIDKYIKRVENIAHSVNGADDQDYVKKSAFNNSGQNEIPSSHFQNSSAPISDQQSASTFNQYDEIFNRETENANKKIDEIFDSVENSKTDFKQVDLGYPSSQAQNESTATTTTFKVNEQQLQGVLTTSLQDKIKIESLERQLSEKDALLKSNTERMILLESELQFSNGKYQELQVQIQTILQENSQLKDQMLHSQGTPTHVSSEIENLKKNIKLYEEQVQKVILSEQNLRQQLESEINAKQNLNCLIEELEYQLSKSLKQVQDQCPYSPSSSDQSKDDMITGLSFEKNSLNDTNKKLNKEIKELKDSQLRTLAEHEKELNKLKEEKVKTENELKMIDEKHKRKHSFIQAENQYVVGQLTVMKIDIDEKNAEIENLKQKIIALEQRSPSKNNSSLFDNEVQQISLNYQALLENEHSRYKETCQTYEMEISHYKQQIQSLVDNGSGSTDDRIIHLKSEILALEKNNEKHLVQIFLLTTKNEEIEKELAQIKQSCDTPEILQKQQYV